MCSEHKDEEAIFNAALGIKSVILLGWRAKTMKTQSILLLTTVVCLAFVGPAYGLLPNDWFYHQNFIEWHFTTVTGETFNDIENDMDNIYNRGTRILFIYCPFHGNPAYWLGCDPIDLYATYPASGTLQDFNDMVAAAHAKGIAVLMYQTLLYLDTQAPFWQQAEQDMADGLNTHHTRCFLWVDTQQDTYDLGVPMSDWAYSSTADKWYATSWGFPGWYFASDDAVDECAAINEFWCQTDIDGFMYDYPPGMIHISDDDRRYLLSTLPESYGVKYRFAEGLYYGFIPQWHDDYGITFGCFGDDIDEENIVNRICNGSATADDLENLLTYTRDPAVEWGGGVARLMVFRTNEDKHILNGAVLAGCGVHVDFFYAFNAPAEDAYVNWSSSRKNKLHKLMNAININPAQEPGAGRLRLSTGSDPQYYAVRRISRDGSQKALNIFNFKSTTETITVDLTNSRITVPQTPYDMYNEVNGPEITSNSYSVTLAPYSFLLLQVDCVGSNPPSVNITSPADGATFEAPADITITAEASDNDGSVIKVEFYNQTTKLGEDTNSPYGGIWPNVDPGLYWLTARATDDTNDVATSSPIWIMIADPCASGKYIWHSYDVNTTSGTQPAIVLDEDGIVAAPIEFYESTNVDGVNKASLFSIFNAGQHAEGFNHLKAFWANAVGEAAYPYAGKSTIGRGSDIGEDGTPAPTGVYDLQLHPPENNRLVVAAFVVPLDGSYSVSNLAARRVHYQGVTVSYKVFDASKTLVSSFQASNNRDWVTDENIYDIGILTAGDRIYFAVDQDGGYGWDATEIAWTITVLPSPDINDDGYVNLTDFAMFSARWPDISCGTCGGADLTVDGSVTYADLWQLVKNWLAGF